MDEKRQFSFLLLILFAKALAIILLVSTGVIGLGPDEAQYWTWSQQLDWGYYSKPPGIAWQIWLGTKIFGNTELGVRFLSIVFGTLMPIALYRLARRCEMSRSGSFWAALLLALSPLGIMGSFLAITDGGLTLFWILAVWAIAGEKPNCSLAGFFVLCGALFKWPIYIFWPVVLLFMTRYPQLRCRSFFTGVLISLLGLLPSFFWNWQHGWPTFLHVYTTIIGGHGKEVGSTPLIKGNFPEFIGSQALLIGPVIFFLALIAYFGIIRHRKKAPEWVLFCGLSSLFIVTVYSIMSLFQKMQGNWCDYAYPTAFVFIAWYFVDHKKWGKRWLTRGVVVSVVLTAIVFTIPFIQQYNLMPRSPISYRINPFRHNVGWKALGEELSEAGYDPHTHFLFGDKYQTSSELSFYGPLQRRSYFLNLEGARKNQFSYWPGMQEEQIGKTGYFVRPENIPYLTRDQEGRIAWFQQELEPYFGNVEYLGVKPLFQNNGEIVKGAFLFKCTNYLGGGPAEVELY